MAGLWVYSFMQMMSHYWLLQACMALKTMLNTCTDFAASHNLLFSALKTKCMYFSDPGSTAEHR